MMPHRVSGLLIKRKAPTALQKQTSRKRESCWGKEGILMRPDFRVSPWDLQLLLAASPKSTAFRQNRFKAHSNHKSPKKRRCGHCVKEKPSDTNQKH
ncbi:hypothetical protein CEXT_698251 [Caerostris extrusa]|uniref:Uncharacterized protein n=1 Tax=Caerostris extrusa TaxID=172846 RepID=A0AAV4QGE5_CAEEX|nr:hypothetical protein CEXT_698251 [Caerostris extrusa]